MQTCYTFVYIYFSTLDFYENMDYMLFISKALKGTKAKKGKKILALF